MLVSASVKNIRLSPDKVRLVVAQIKKMSPQDAINMLGFINKSSSPILKKVIMSAIANAKNNYGLSEGTLTFKEIIVGKGPMSKRYRPISRGRAHEILKRTAHITVVLSGQKIVKSQDSTKKENVETEKNNGGKAITKTSENDEKNKRELKSGTKG